MKKLLALVLAMAFALVPFMSLSAQEFGDVDLNRINERIRYLEELEARLLELEARQANAAVTPRANDISEIQQWIQQRAADSTWYPGICWDADGNWVGYEGCPRVSGEFNGCGGGGCGGMMNRGRW